jgi:hypothetical protein
MNDVNGRTPRWAWVGLGVLVVVVVIGLTLQDGPSTPAPGPALSLEPARSISSREWAQIAKAPDSHAGQRVIVFGVVTQFDASTGEERFRANVDGERQAQWFDYDTNTVLTGTNHLLGDLVADDVFRAEVTVLGAYTYDTTMGGSMSVPQLAVTRIDVIGHTS